MIKKGIVYIISIVLFSSFIEINSKVETVSINGKWSLKKITAGFSPEEYFLSNQITWEFNSQNKLIVKININLNKSSKITVKENGEYYFKVKNNNILKIEDLDYTYFIRNDKLIISFIEVGDGPRMEFVKSP